MIQLYEAIGFGGFDNAVEDGAGLRASGGVAKQPVLPPNNEGFYCSFCTVVVDVESAIFGVTSEFVPLVQAVIDGISHFRFGCHLQ